MTVLIVIALAWVALIFFGGSRFFGRSSTQRLIDHWRNSPRVYAFLNRHHGAIRASFHYIEFGTLSLILHMVLRLHWSEGLWSWQATALTLIVTSLLAYLDEKRQELTPGRQFRTIDFIHSMIGLTAMQVIIALVALIRWLA
jgi:VanZ family protein